MARRQEKSIASESFESFWDESEYHFSRILEDIEEINGFLEVYYNYIKLFN